MLLPLTGEIFIGFNSGGYRSSATTWPEKTFPCPQKPWFDYVRGTVVLQFASHRAEAEVRAAIPARSRCA